MKVEEAHAAGMKAGRAGHSVETNPFRWPHDESEPEDVRNEILWDAWRDGWQRGEAAYLLSVIDSLEDE